MFMHKHTFSGPGVRLKRARTLGPEKSRTLEFSNPADPDLGPGEFENHMKCFHVLTNPTHEMNFDLCFFLCRPEMFLAAAATEYVYKMKNEYVMKVRDEKCFHAARFQLN